MKKILRIFILLLIVIFASWFWWKFYFTYSEGNRAGLLQKMSHKGNLFKTYEGELVLTSLTVRGESPLSSEKFYFTVTDETLGEKMKDFQGKRVVLHYNEKNGILPWRGDTQYIVDSIQVIDQ